jgi:hypothetical protein
MDRSAVRWRGRPEKRGPVVGGAPVSGKFAVVVVEEGATLTGLNGRREVATGGGAPLLRNVALPPAMMWIAFSDRGSAKWWSVLGDRGAVL